MLIEWFVTRVNIKTESGPKSVSKAGTEHRTHNSRHVLYIPSCTTPPGSSSAPTEVNRKIHVDFNKSYTRFIMSNTMSQITPWHDCGSPGIINRDRILISVELHLG